MASSPSFIPHVMGQTAFFGSRRACQQKRLKPLREFRTCLDWFLVVIKPWSMHNHFQFKPFLVFSASTTIRWIKRLTVSFCRKAQELPHEGWAAEQRRVQEVYETRAVRVFELQVLPHAQSHPLHPIPLWVRSPQQWSAILPQTKGECRLICTILLIM